MADYKGTSVSELSGLRRALNDTSAKFKIAKNTLAKLAAEQSSKDALSEEITGPLGFVLTNEERIRSKTYGSFAGKMHTAMHEVLGHASGKIEKGVGTPKETLKSYASTMEEARADLFGLYYIMDPKLVDIGLIESNEVGKAEYDGYIRNGLMLQLRRLQPGENIEQAHMRNRAFVSHWVFEKGLSKNVIEKKIVHDKVKKQLIYKDSILNLYDMPIFYFPKFFHPKLPFVTSPLVTQSLYKTFLEDHPLHFQHKRHKPLRPLLLIKALHPTLGRPKNHSACTWCLAKFALVGIIILLLYLSLLKYSFGVKLFKLSQFFFC